jgi:hypothetical protein
MAPTDPQVTASRRIDGVGRRRAPLILKLLTVLSSLLVGFLLAELGLRIVGAIRGIDYSLYMRELTNTDRLPKAMWLGKEFHSLTPGVKVLATTSDFSVIYQINSDGWRDREHKLTKAPGVVRAIALGDSFTFGEGVEYGRRFSDIPQAHFRNLEILNFGVPGFGLDQALVALVHNGFTYAPDAVILFLNWPLARRHNTEILRDGALDLSDALRREPSHDASTIYLTHEAARRLDRGSFLFRHSKLLTYLRYRITLRRLRPRLREQDRSFWQGFAGSKTDDTRVVHDGDAEEYALLIVRKLQELGRAHAYRLIVVNIDPSWELKRARELEAEGVAYHGLQAELRAESSRRRLRFVYDPHFTPATHAYLGRRVIEILRRELPALRE